MRRLQRLSWAVPLVFCALGGAALGGCKAQAELKVGTPPPPPPPPPPPDQDGDGIADPDDKCPTEKEDGNPPDPQDGCPNKDMDGDGIPVPEDKCPDQPETVNDFEDADGCADTKPIVQLKATEVQINQKIQFKKDKADIEQESLVVVDAVADLLKKNPEVQLIELGGHASNEGAEYYNKNLTQKRVEAVMKALTERGVEKDRIMAQGYGAYCLLDPGTTEEAHEKNRRVEFKILYRKGKDLEQKRGCEAAEKKNVKPKPLPKLKPFGDAPAADPKAAPADPKAAPAAKPGDAKAPPPMAPAPKAAAPAAPATPATPPPMAPAPKTAPGPAPAAPPALTAPAAAPKAAAPAPAAPAAPATPATPAK